MKLALICLLLLCNQSLAWWEVGHMMTAQVAKIYLEETNSEVLAWAESLIKDFDELTDGRSNTFVTAAVWADDIKEPGTNFLDNWHFTNFPINKDGLMIVIDPVGFEQNSMDAMRRAFLVLTNKQTINQDHSWAKAQMIRYVLHVIGDIHQPLHNINFYNATHKKGDQGGNMINVLKPDGTRINLHAYWDAGAFVLQPNDDLLVRPLNESSITYLEQWSTQHMQKYPISFFADKDMTDFTEWTQEGYQQAADLAYPFFAQTDQINEEYEKLVYSIVEQNIVLGGYRLGLFLTKIYENIKISKLQVSFVENKLTSMKYESHYSASNFGSVTTQI